jgi:hypothetical protein
MIRAYFVSIVIAFAGANALAQDGDELRAKELQAKIKRQMSEIDELLLNAEKADAATAKEKIDAVRKSIDELLKDVNGKQAEVVSDIEELVRMAKAKQSKNSPSSSGKQPPKNQESQQNPQRERDGEVDELKPQGEKPQGEQPQEGEQKPESGKPDDATPQKEDETGQKPPDEKGAFEREDVSGRWGVLPGKVEEMFKKLSSERFPDRYRKLIEQYYRKSQKVPQK